MTKESRVFVRLIALWIIFILSVAVIFWAGQNFAVALVKMVSGSYSSGPMMGGYMPMTLASCIMMPPYPSGPGMGMGVSMEGAGGPDQASMEKYNAEYQKYTEAYQQACKEDVMRQQGMQKSFSVVDIVGYSVLVLLSGLSAVLSMFAIKRAEELHV